MCSNPNPGTAGNSGYSGNRSNSGSTSKRSNLFVVRIWRGKTVSTTGITENVGQVEREESRIDAKGWEWQGRVQRAVSGEEHHFEGWPALIELLEEMLTDAHSHRGQSSSTEIGYAKRQVEGRDGRDYEK